MKYCIHENENEWVVCRVINEYHPYFGATCVEEMEIFETSFPTREEAEAYIAAN